MQLQIHIKELPSICLLSVDYLPWGFDCLNKFGVNAFWSKPIWIMNEKRSICPSHQDMTTTPRLPCWRSWKNRWENTFLTCSWEKVKRKLSNQNCPFLIVESFAGDLCRAVGIYDGYTLNRACQEACLLENGNSFG